VLVLWCLAHEEIMLAPIEPRERIASAIILQKLKFVRCGNDVAALITIGIAMVCTLMSLLSILLRGALSCLYAVDIGIQRRVRDVHLLDHRS
jgi:hypothetical protein